MWRAETVKGETKPRKMPYYVSGGRRKEHHGSAPDRAALTSFAAARDAAARGGYDGVGFAPLPGLNIVALDFDNCVGPGGELPQEVRDIVSCTYAEYSPSGNGVRAFFIGDLGNHKSKTTPNDFGFEVFSTTGYVTLTGNALPCVELLDLSETVAHVTDNVRALCDRKFGAERQAPASVSDDPFAGHEPKLGLTIARMEELLRQLDPDMGRDQWIRVGMALHHECEGDDTGFALWNEWSSNGGKYPGEEALQEQWNSFDRPKAPRRRQVTMASVIRMAKEASAGPTAATAEELQAVAAETSAGDPKAGVGTPEGFTGKFPAVSAAELSRRPPPDWLIKSVLPKANVAVLFGPSGSGKSFVALDMGGAIARGIPWRGHRTIKGRVLIIAAEGGGGVGKRLKAYVQHHQINIDELEIAVIVAAPNFLLKDDISEVVKTVRAAGGFDLIITDTFAQVTPGANENAGEDMGLALSNARALSEVTGALVLLIHHAGKDTSKGSRGWSGIKAAADAEFEVTKHDSGVREMHITKMKDGEEGQKFAFKLTQIDLGCDKDSGTITSCVVETFDGFISPKSKKAERQGAVQQALCKAARDLGADTVGADYQAVIDQAVRSMKPNPNKDQRRSNAKKTLGTLLKNGVLFLREDRLYSPDVAPKSSEGVVH